MTLLDRLTLSGICLYRRLLSPHKGFRCAHAALHGGEPCSAAVARIVREDGVIGGHARVAARFRECRAVQDLLRGGSPLAFGTDGPRVRGVCCCGPVPIPFRCG